jgi:hypothetical protein
MIYQRSESGNDCENIDLNNPLIFTECWFNWKSFLNFSKEHSEKNIVEQAILKKY